MDQRDAKFLCRQGGGDIDRLVVQQQFARAGRVHAGEDFHQRAFAGAVFAHEGVDFAGTKIEIDRFQHAYAGE